MSNLGTGTQQPTGWVDFQGGALSLVYLIHHFLALFVLPSALLIFALGLGATLVDPSDAFTHWSWWRIYGVYFVVFAIPLVTYYVYQERKIAFSSSGTAVQTYSRAQVQFIFGVYMVVLVVLASWLTILVIWLGVTDFQECAASPLCSGPTLQVRPCTGAIMVITAMCVMPATLWALVLLGIYVHSAAREAYFARADTYFGQKYGLPFQNEIGAEMQQQHPLLEMQQKAAAAPGAQGHMVSMVNGEIRGVTAAPRA